MRYDLSWPDFLPLSLIMFGGLDPGGRAPTPIGTPVGDFLETIIFLRAPPVGVALGMMFSSEFL